MEKIDISKVREGQGDVFSSDSGHGVAVYRKEDGTLEIFSADCPHANCDVVWNGFSKEWHCPCHGSRFDTHGKVLEGPAEKDLTRLDAKVEKDSIEI